MVVAFHAGLPLPGGFVGVDVFFVISGFVITGMLVREWTSTGRIRLGRFYVRRFKRLTPALALVVSVTVLASIFVLSPLGTQQDTARTGFGAMLLAANLVIAKITGGYFDLEAETNGLLNTWSLSVEEQFYLAFPLILFTALLLGSRTSRLRAAPITLVFAIGGASFGMALLGASGFALPTEAWLLGFYSPITRAWEFAAGAILALAATRATVTSGRAASFLATAGLALLVASVLAIDGSVPFPGLATVVPVAGAVVLIQAGSFATNPVSRILSSTPLVRLGDWSYSIYLWHWPVIVFATLTWPTTPFVPLLAAAASLAPAIASYRWVESPLRSLTGFSGRRLGGLVAATVGVPLVLATGVWQAAAHGFGIAKVQDFQTAVFAQPDGCSVFEPLTEELARRCTWNADSPGQPIYLLGDSNAGHFVDAVKTSGETLDRPVVVATTNSCPFVDVPLVRLDKDDSWNQACRGFVDGSLSYLGRSDPGVVIISNIDTYWDSPEYAVQTAQSSESTRPGAKLESLSRGLTETVGTLQSAGHEVLLVQTIPRWSGSDTWRTASCTIWRIADDQCVQEMPVSHAEARQGDVRQVITTVGRQSSSPVLDLWPVLCEKASCSTQGSEFPLYYRDGLHVSVPEGAALAPEFESALISIN